MSKIKIPKFINKMDWRLLNAQKLTLLNVIENYNNINDSKINPDIIIDNLNGIVHVIDAPQDYAVDKLGFDENYIFDFDEDYEDKNGNLLIKQ